MHATIPRKLFWSGGQPPGNAPSTKTSLEVLKARAYLRAVHLGDTSGALDDLDEALEASGYRAMLADGSEEGEERWANLLELRSVTTRYDDLTPEDDELVGHMVRCAAGLAHELGYGGRGYRLVFNAGPDAGQSVFHIHLHLLAGRHLGWPPG